MLSTFEIPVTSCRNVLELEQIEAVPGKLKRWNRASQAVMFLRICQQAVERFKFIQCFVWQSFLPPTRLQAC